MCVRILVLLNTHINIKYFPRYVPDCVILNICLASLLLKPLKGSGLLLIFYASHLSSVAEPHSWYFQMNGGGGTFLSARESNVERACREVEGRGPQRGWSRVKAGSETVMVCVGLHKGTFLGYSTSRVWLLSSIHVLLLIL